MKIASTTSTPEVDFDFANNHLRLVGESHPENVTEFYGPILSKLETYLAELGEQSCTFDFQFVYFNSSSAKIVMTLMEQLEDAAQAGGKVLVRWFFDPEDDNMIELGEEFGEDLEAASFELVPLELDEATTV